LRLAQTHSFFWRLTQAHALPHDGGSDTRGSGWIASRNVVFDLVEILLGKPCEKNRQHFHRRERRRRRSAAGTSGRRSARAVWMTLVRSSRLGVAALASYSSSKRRPARITSDLLLKRPLAIKRSISRSKCGVIALLIVQADSNSYELLSKFSVL